jgi:chromosome segregation ATPase
MKLVWVKVENFRCIRSAKIDFTDGLNILYGPNDLGKSSLAHAIRAVLLLQTTAADHKAFISWHGGGDPTVELVFESEPQRIWRVRKTFGTANAHLEFSRDGVDFSPDCRGRQVDERLSEILQWGIVPPGGKGRPKGMPSTFLTAALLAEQDQVGSIFKQPLAEDSDESGKKLLIAALQAMAEDPTFKSVLDRVHERWGEAFNLSSDGKVSRKRGKNSPWVKINEEIQRKQQSAEATERELQETKALQDEFERLQDRRVDLKEAVVKARESLEALEGRVRLEGVARQLRDLAEAERSHAAGAVEIDRLTKLHVDAQTARDAAAAKAQEEKEKLDRLQSKDRARERQLEQSKLEGRRSELRSEQLRQEASLAGIRTVEGAAAKVATLEAELKKLSAQAADLLKKQESAAAERTALEAQERELREMQAFFRFHSARNLVQEAERGLAQVGQWRDEVAAKRAEAAGQESAKPRLTLPSREQLDQLRRLAGDLRVAAAKLDVGLVVTLRPKKPLHVSVQRDGERVTLYDLKQKALETTAKRQLELDIEGVAEISLAGGAADARETVEALEKRWAAEARPILQQAGVATIDDLARLISEAEQGASTATDALREAAQLEQRIGDQPDWASLLDDRRRQLDESVRALADADLDALAASIERLKVRDALDAEKRLDALRVQFGALAKNEKERDAEFASASTRVSEKQKALDETGASLARAQSAISGDWQTALRNVEAQQTATRREVETIETSLQRLSTDEDQTLTAAKKALTAATQAVTDCDTAVQQAQQKLTDATLARATAEGLLNARRDAVAHLDSETIRAATELITATPVTAEMLSEAQRVVAEANREWDSVENAIREKRGALQHVGGEVARQRAEDANTELETVRERAHRMEMEFDAWELLRKTLREAEQEEGTNLGHALADPIAKRFTALTTNRYGKFALGPNLETQGIAVGGENRLVEALSVGTRDQLSTIFRLTLAEQLKTAVLLDDQLAQSDLGRMTWLRDLLKEVAGKIQIIVLTCRPEDYAIVPGKRGKPDFPSRAVDLVKFIDRWIT